MDGTGIKLKEFLGLKSLEVPFFQRPYVWGNKDFEALIDSLDDSPECLMPFFGSVILQEIVEESGEYLIIDGQQRCMTFSIIIRAILDVCKDEHVLSITQKSNLISYIYNVKVDAHRNETYSMKLTPSNPDQMTYEKIMDAKAERPVEIEDETKDPIENAYKYFFDYFSEDEARILSVFNRIDAENKSIIKITLSKKDDEQKIFDSVNSLGKTLSNADIIKNYIFQKLREKAKDDKERKDEITKLYYKYWDSIFASEEKRYFWNKEITVGRVKTDNLECFLKDFAIIKKIYTAKTTTGSYGLCNAFKEHVNGMESKELEKLVKEINAYAKVYYDYKEEFEELNVLAWNDSVNRLLLILNELDTTTFNPYILMVLKKKAKEAKSRFLNLERFILKRFIFDGTTKNYNQVCEKLLSSSDDKAYLDEYMEESPVNNTTYKDRFRKFTNRQARLLLFLIEMKKREGVEEKYSDTFKISTYSLEHIMPKKWHDNWLDVDSYDEEGKEVDRNNVEGFNANRDLAIKSLGNMALLTTKLNTSISNSDIKTKMEGKKGKKSKDGIKKYASSLITTKDIIDVYDETGKWDERNIYDYEKSYYDVLNKAYNLEK